ncbi:MAG: GAF domain-containing protein, partial [Acidimicrobiales bacterium]
MVAAWVLASILVVRILAGESHRMVAARAVAWLFVVVTGVVVVSILAFARISNRRIRQGLQDADLTLRSMELVTDPVLSFLLLDELLDELLARTLEVVGGDIATVLLLTPDGRFLTVRASRGLEQWMVIGSQVLVGEGVIGSVAAQAEAVIVDDVARAAGSASPFRERVASLVASPLLVGGRVIGVAIVGTRDPHRFNQSDLRLLRLVADRAAASIERARLDVLSTALESYEDTLVDLVEVVVPSFADWFAVDLVGDAGRVVRIAYGARGERPHGIGHVDSVGEDEPARRMTEAGFNRHRHPDGDRLIRRALTTGQPEVVLNSRRMGPSHGGELAAPGEYTDAAPADGVESMVVVPVYVRGLAFGALSLVTGSGRRGYRRSDLDTALGLAERVAIAVERVLSWRETRQAERAANRHADQLRRLVEAALEVYAPLDEPEVLRILADHARHVLDADWAVVVSARSQDKARAELVSQSGGTGGAGLDPDVAEVA